MLMLCEDSSSTFGMRLYFKSFSTDQDVLSVKIESLAELTESAGPADSAGRLPAKVLTKYKFFTQHRFVVF